MLTGCRDTAPESSAPVSEDPTTQSTTASAHQSTTNTTEGTAMTTTQSHSSTGSTAGTKAPTASSTRKTSATTAKPSNTVTYTGTLDKAVTAKATFTGKSGKPNFTDEQIKAQKKAGKTLLEQIRVAARNPEISTFVIPAGNYGFEQTVTVNGVKSGAVLMDIQRTADNPFTIKAAGVTFWFEMTGEPRYSATRAFHMVNCSNVIIEDLTLDGYTAFAIEGEITAIDKAGNRIGFRPYEGTMELDNQTLKKAAEGGEFRMLTLKADGTYAAPLYKIDNQWGPGSGEGVKLELEGDTAWFTLKTTQIMNTVFTDQWLSTYGKQGTIEVGDGICLIYGYVLGWTLDNCERIQMRRVSSYISKSGYFENGGYGDHLWKDCYFGPRPGTNRILGGEGGLSQALRHGSTFDGCVFNFSADDSVNIHGFWSEIQTVEAASGGGYLCTINYAPVGIRAGDKAELYASSGKLVATLTVKSAPNTPQNLNGVTNPFTFVEQPPANYADLLVRWPASECAGFAIRNCTFRNVFQRFLINSGSGVVENNLFLHMGSNFALTSNVYAYEGGVMHYIVVKNNVFYNCTTHPDGVILDLSQTTNWANYVSAQNITLTDNVFVGCGKLLNAVNMKNLSVTDNLVVEPVLYGKELTKFKDLAKTSASCSIKDYEGNVV